MVQSILVATHAVPEAEALIASLSGRYAARPISRDTLLSEITNGPAALVLDSGISEDRGIDVLMDVLATAQVPVLMITPANEPACAIEALRYGAAGYLVKSGDYTRLVTVALDEILLRSDREEQLKRTIVNLRQRLTEAERQLAQATQAGFRADAGSSAPGDGRARLLAEVARRLSSADSSLPAYSQLSEKFRQLMGRDGVSIKEVAQLLSQDAAVSVKLIRLANSPLYRSGMAIATVEQAIGQLGMAKTASLVEMVVNRSLYLNANRAWTPLMEQLWRTSLAAACAGRVLAEEAGLPGPESVFSVTLLHSAGKLLLLQVMAELDPDGAHAKSPDEVISIMEFLEQHHGRLGAALLKRWNFPENFQQAALHCAAPEKAPGFTKEILVVHLADLIAPSLANAEYPPGLEQDAGAKFLGLDAQTLTSIHARSRAALEAYNSATA